MAEDKKYLFEIDFLKRVRRKDTRDIAVTELLASYLTKAGRYKEGLRLDKKIIQLDPENPIGYYNLACSYALLKEPETAIETLKEAISNGYRDFNWMMEDPDLESLHNLPEFNTLIEELKIN